MYVCLNMSFTALILNQNLHWLRHTHTHGCKQKLTNGTKIKWIDKMTKSKQITLMTPLANHFFSACKKITHQKRFSTIHLPHVYLLRYQHLKAKNNQVYTTHILQKCVCP